ncbi:MAG: AraC family transcriptional regulator [Advenella sp.]
MSPQQMRMVELIKRLAPCEGYTQSLLDGVTFMRSNRPLATTQALYEPSIVIVIQGRKRGVHGGNLYVYDAQHYLVLSVPLPFSTETEASEAAPMLGVVLRIDTTTTADIAIAIDDGVPPSSSKPVSMYATRMEEKLQDATLRLLEALNSPVEARVLAPAILREITFRVLTGDQGSSLLAALRQGGHFGRIAKVLRKIHIHYASDLTVAALADEASLSVPAFHVHFKAITMNSPIQYIKAIRLHNARLMMARKGMSAASASEQVGYESASQFSREFKRLFGRSPTQELQHLKQILSMAAPVLHPPERSHSQGHL